MRTRSVSPPILSSFAVRNDRPSYWIDATSPRRRATTYGPRRSATCQAFALVGSQGIARRCNVRTSSFQRPSYRGHSRSPSASTSLLYSYPRGVQVAKIYKARVTTAIWPLANDRAIGMSGRRHQIDGTKCRYFCRYRCISY